MIEIIYHGAQRVYSLISYFNSHEKIISIYYGNEYWYWFAFIMSTFSLFSCIWSLLFTKTIDICLIKLSHSTLYVGENIHISESKSNEAEKSMEGSSGAENKLEVLDYFGKRKFTESDFPSISSSKSEVHAEGEDQFGSYS